MQFDQDRNSEEVSLIFSCAQLVNYAVSDEIRLEDINMAAIYNKYGIDNNGRYPIAFILNIINTLNTLKTI